MLTFSCFPIKTFHNENSQFHQSEDAFPAIFRVVLASPFVRQMGVEFKLDVSGIQAKWAINNRHLLLMFEDFAIFDLPKRINFWQNCQTLLVLLTPNCTFCQMTT